MPIGWMNWMSGRREPVLPPRRRRSPLDRARTKAQRAARRRSRS